MLNKNHLQKWIAIYTKSRHEKVVTNTLIDQGYKAYLPMLKKKRKWSDRKVWVEFPLFKSYVFVQTEISNTLFISQINGVVKIIKFNGKVAIIQDESIEAIKLMINGGYAPKSIDYFIKGDPVRVIKGPLKGLIGEVTQLENQNRLLIKVDAIQHSLSIKIDPLFLKLL